MGTKENMCFQEILTRGGHSIVKLKTMCNSKKSTFSKLHHQNGSKFYQIFLGVDIHDTYYIVETDNQIWWSFFLENIPFLAKMTHNWTK